MQPMTKQEQIAEIDAAITTILKGGQSYKIGSRSLTRADLSVLRAWKKELESMEDNNTSDLFDNTYAVFFDGR
jgi:hypothetical protein|nr:MAG TPA: hypothetical protein [Caudoviricetes sp.]